ncbi:hypothetical protein N9A25_00330 [bacterium]|nr:hypothetical protein [bacterium]
MFIEEFTEKTVYRRVSKHGKEHEYTRNRSMFRILCDNCGSEFVRSRSNMDPKRASDNYFHVCSNCDAKRFAQRKGVEQKKIWDLPASSNLPINKF